MLSGKCRANQRLATIELLEARSADGGISRRAAREEQGDDRKAPAGSVAEAACPSGQRRSRGGGSQGCAARSTAGVTKKAPQNAVLFS